MKLLKIILTLVLCVIADHSVLALTLNNTSPFYLNLVTSSGTCPQQIAPGQKNVTVNGYCGYDACATDKFNQDPQSPGCEEWKDVNHSSLTQGGYATYFGINTSPNTTCSIAGFVPYQCSIDAAGNFSLNYLSLLQQYSAGPHVRQPVMLPTTISHYASGPIFRGVNLSGLEYDGTFLDGLYQHPDIPDERYFAEQGMNIVRLPIRWEFVIANANNPIESSNPNANAPSVAVNKIYLAAVYDTVQKYLQQGVSVDLDLHNYMRFCPTGVNNGQGNEPTDPINNGCQIVSATQLANIWQTIMTAQLPLRTSSGIQTVTFAGLAKHYAPKDASFSGPQLIFELMNEPYTRADQPLATTDVFNNEVAAVQAIRNAGVNNLILLSGNYWDPLHAWLTSDNATVFTAANLRAAGIDTSNIAIDMHQYFDTDYSGLHQVCNHYDSPAAMLQDLHLTDATGKDIFSDWVKNNNMKIFLGEFGAADTMPDGSPNLDCHKDMSTLLHYISDPKHAYDPANAQNGGFIGWTAWRGNRNGSGGFGFYTYLQQADNTVYGAPSEGNGIAQGPGNGLMAHVLANFLNPATMNK